jgi:hypothetical protein
MVAKYAENIRKAGGKEIKIRRDNHNNNIIFKTFAAT